MNFNHLFITAPHQHQITSHSSATQVAAQNITPQQPPGGSTGPMGHVSSGAHPAQQPQQFFSGAPAAQPVAVQERSAVPETLTAPLPGTPPVTSHLHQNGFNNGGTNMGSTGSANSNQQPLATGQTFTGAQGTWKGSNTLTYTQSMQPPDNRNHCASYCM